MPVQTLDSQSALLQKYQQEILELRSRLLANEASLDDSLAREKDEETRRLDGLKDERKRAEEDIAEMQLQRIRLQEQIEHLNRRILTSKSVDANVRRASLENGSDGSMTPARRGRISDIGIGPSPLGGGIMDVGLRKSGSRGRLSNILEAVGSPRVGTVEKEAALEKELEELRQTSQKELAAKNDRIQELEHGLETTNARLESATSEAQTARSSLLEQEQQLATVRTSVLALESSLDRLQKEKQDLVEEQDQTKDVTSSQADKVARLEAKVGDLARLLDSANAEKTTVTASAEEKGARLLVLEAEARELRLGLSDVTSARDLDVKQLERRTEELEAERATVVSLQTQLADAVAAAKSVSAGLEAQVAAAQGERDQARQEVQGLNIKLAEVEKLVTAVQDEAKKASTDLAMQSETKRQELETKRQELETTQAENRTLKIDLEDIRGQLARLQDQQRHSIQVTSLSSSRGPNTDGLKAKLAALQKKQNGTASEPASAPGSSGSTSSPSENVESAVELQAMVEEQKTRIKKLETDLMDARRQATEALAKDLAHLSPARPRPSSYASSPGRTELQHTKSLKETPQRDRHQTAESRRTTAAAEEEIDRLNEVIKSQKNMLSDARTDMAKWQAVRRPLSASAVTVTAAKTWMRRNSVRRQRSSHSCKRTQTCLRPGSNPHYPRPSLFCAASMGRRRRPRCRLRRLSAPTASRNLGGTARALLLAQQGPLRQNTPDADPSRLRRRKPTTTCTGACRSSKGARSHCQPRPGSAEKTKRPPANRGGLRSRTTSRS